MDQVGEKGVGRGNGEGSKATRFKKGGPSGNPAGRPRKSHRSTTPDALVVALLRRLAIPVTVIENGRRKKMSRVDAIAESVLKELPHASLKDQITALKLLTSLTANTPEVARRASIPTVVEFVEGLAAAARDAEEVRENLQ